MYIFEKMSIQGIMMIVGFVSTVILGPLVIPVLRKLKFGQTVRDDGPGTHLIKTGTPTMGGVIFLIPILIISLIYSFYSPKLIPLIFATFGFGMIGFIDDFIKVVKKRKDGLYAKQKMLGLLVVATIFSVYVAKFDGGTNIYIPFWGLDNGIDFSWMFIPFSIFVMLAVTNAVNLTDGIDGLAAIVTMIVMVFFTLVAVTNNQWYHVKVFSALISGGCLGFLVFNLHPAKVFMGDTGSLALGGAVGAVSIIMKLPLILVIVGAIYVIETLAVILQVASFKLRGKRIFKMAPIHHHFELSGWKETTIVTVFALITFVMCFIGILALRIRL